MAEPWSVPVLCVCLPVPSHCAAQRQGAGCPLAAETLQWSRAALIRHLARLAPHAWRWPLVAALPAVWPVLPLAVCPLTNSQGGDPRTPEVLRWALPCVRVAPNSQERGPSTPSATLVAHQLGDGPAALLMQTARGGDPKTQEAGGPTIPWDLVPYLAPRARLPLFWFRPPPPCPWAAAITSRAKARLLRCCRCLLVNVDTLPVPGHHRPWRPQRAL